MIELGLNIPFYLPDGLSSYIPDKILFAKYSSAK